MKVVNKVDKFRNNISLNRLYMLLIKRLNCKDKQKN